MSTGTLSKPSFSILDIITDTEQQIVDPSYGAWAEIGRAHV